MAALAMDAALGEPPAAVHPVILMGRALDTLERQAPRSEGWRLWYGLGVAIGLPAVCSAFTGSLSVGLLVTRMNTFATAPPRC